MNKKVPQLSTDNKMLTVHQQEVDAKKIIDLGTRVPVLRTPIASDVLTEAAHSLPEPYAQTLQGALAGQWKIPQQHVVCCPSTSEAYLAIAEYFRQTSVLLPQPCSTAYERVTTLCRLRQISFDLRQEEDFQFNESQLQNELSSVALVMVGNPHNPTGQYFPRKTLLSLIDDNPQTCFMIDESDLALVDLDSSNSLVPTIRPNLIVLRTLAESHGWLGLGPSYLVTGNLDLLAFLSKRFSATSISGWLQQIGLELGHQEPTVQREELADLRQEFLPQLQSNSHLKIVPGNAPYHLFQLSSELLAPLREQCSAKNLTLRWGEHYSGLADNHLRISLQHREGLQRFLSVLQQLER